MCFTRLTSLKGNLLDVFFEIPYKTCSKSQLHNRRCSEIQLLVYQKKLKNLNAAKKNSTTFKSGTPRHLNINGNNRFICFM